MQNTSPQVSYVSTRSQDVQAVVSNCSSQLAGHLDSTIAERRREGSGGRPHRRDLGGSARYMPRGLLCARRRRIFCAFTISTCSRSMATIATRKGKASRDEVAGHWFWESPPIWQDWILTQTFTNGNRILAPWLLNCAHFLRGYVRCLALRNVAK